MSSEPVLRVLDNPIGVAQARRRLRKKHALPGLAAIGVSAVCVLLYAGTNAPDDAGWRNARDLLLAGIAGLLCLRGTGQVSAVVAEDRRSGLLDFHRATPTSAWTDAFGYIAGCAAREHAGAWILAPCFLFASVLAGGTFLNGLAALYVILATGLLCHVFGALIGLARRGGRPASFALGALLVAFALAASADPAHFAAVRHLTPLPALRSLGFLGSLATPESLGSLGSRLGELEPVTFFGVPISHVNLTILVQGHLVVFLAWATARRLRSDALPAFSRGGALLFFALSSGLFLAPTWARLAEGEFAAHAVGIHLVLGVLLATLLGASLVPSFLGSLRRIRRARRLDLRTRWTHEGASAWSLVPRFAALLVAGLALVLLRARSAGAFAPEAIWSAQTAFALAGCTAFLAFAFGALEYYRLVRRNASVNGLLLIGFAALVVPAILGAIAAQLLADPGLSRYLYATSPIFAVAGPVDRLVGHLSGRTGTFEWSQLSWSLAVTSVAARLLWRRVRRVRAGIRADEAMTGDLPSIDTFRDAG